jgi:predicted dehydrogenase
MIGVVRPTTPRVALAGIGGYGTSHLRNLVRLEAAGAARFVAAADPRGAPAPGVPLYRDLDEMLARHQPDVVVISTPIHTHVPLAERALRSGADVLLEKPPAPSFAEFERLRAVVADTGRSCQVGFQALGSGPLAALRSAIAAGELGALRGIGGAGAWLRRRRYWARSPWAGRRTLDGMAVTDGALTNPFAHATAVALALDDSTRADDVARVEVELYRANDIEADDTSCVRIETVHGTPIVIALTLCAAANADPVLIVHGSAGRVELRYAAAGERMDLLENLLAHRADPAVPLIAGLDSTGGFMRVLEAVRTAPDPAPIDPAIVDWLDDHPVVRDVEHWIGRAAEELATFTELGAPWTRR